ncbi:hypothetical protein I3760_07G114000 [Carya illinoinensis]|nr:hypothetical protein I3760_07G114000 [Carya illinoinensis]
MSGETERIEMMMHSGNNGYGNGVMTSASAATTPVAMTLSSSSTNAQSRGHKTYLKNPEGRHKLYLFLFFFLMFLFWDFLFLCSSPEVFLSPLQGSRKFSLSLSLSLSKSPTRLTILPCKKPAHAQAER